MDWGLTILPPAEPRLSQQARLSTRLRPQTYSTLLMIPLIQPIPSSLSSGGWSKNCSEIRRRTICPNSSEPRRCPTECQGRPLSVRASSRPTGRPGALPAWRFACWAPTPGWPPPSSSRGPSWLVPGPDGKAAVQIRPATLPKVRPGRLASDTGRSNAGPPTRSPDPGFLGHLHPNDVQPCGGRYPAGGVRSGCGANGEKRARWLLCPRSRWPGGSPTVFPFEFCADIAHASPLFATPQTQGNRSDVLSRHTDASKPPKVPQMPAFRHLDPGRRPGYLQFRFESRNPVRCNMFRFAKSVPGWCAFGLAIVCGIVGLARLCCCGRAGESDGRDGHRLRRRRGEAFPAAGVEAWDDRPGCAAGRQTTSAGNPVCRTGAPATRPS